MEKKLTDEEWFEEYAKACKALEDCYFEQLAFGGTSDAQTEKEIEFDRRLIAYVHRLQEDYSKLKERYIKVLDLNENVIEEQKNEIERLKGFIDFKTANVMCEKCKEQVVKDTAEKVFNEVMSCIGSLQMFWIVDGKARTLVDAEKLFEESCKIAKKHGICLDEEETKDEAKTVQWSKYEVE